MDEEYVDRMTRADREHMLAQAADVSWERHNRKLAREFERAFFLDDIKQDIIWQITARWAQEVQSWTTEVG